MTTQNYRLVERKEIDAFRCSPGWGAAPYMAMRDMILKTYASLPTDKAELMDKITSNPRLRSVGRVVDVDTNARYVDDYLVDDDSRFVSRHTDFTTNNGDFRAYGYPLLFHSGEDFEKHLALGRSTNRSADNSLKNWAYGWIILIGGGVGGGVAQHYMTSELGVVVYGLGVVAGLTYMCKSLVSPAISAAGQRRIKLTTGDEALEKLIEKYNPKAKAPT